MTYYVVEPWGADSSPGDEDIAIGLAEGEYADRFNGALLVTVFEWIGRFVRNPIVAIRGHTELLSAAVVTHCEVRQSWTTTIRAAIHDSVTLLCIVGI